MDAWIIPNRLLRQTAVNKFYYVLRVYKHMCRKNSKKWNCEIAGFKGYIHLQFWHALPIVFLNVCPKLDPTSNKWKEGLFLHSLANQVHAKLFNFSILTAKKRKFLVILFASSLLWVRLSIFFIFQAILFSLAVWTGHRALLSTRNITNI